MKYTKETFPEKWYFTIPENKWKEVEQYADNFYTKSGWSDYQNTHKVVEMNGTKPTLLCDNKYCKVSEITYEEFEQFVLQKTLTYEIY